MKDRDPRRVEWLEAFVKTIQLQIGRATNGVEGKDFSILMTSILQACLPVRDRQAGTFGGQEFRIMDAVRDLGLPAKTIRRYLKTASRAGIIKCVSIYDEAEKRRRPLEVVWNPRLLELLGKTQLSDAKVNGGLYAELWMERVDELGDPQGFTREDLAQWGFWRGKGNKKRGCEVLKAEPVEASPRDPSTLTQRMDAAAAGSTKLVSEIKRQAKAAERAQKNRERLARLAEEQRFIDGCATVWVTMRSRAGFGTEQPVWAGPLASLSQAAKAQRAEIVATFRRYGGKKAAVAWACFCGSHALENEKGQRKFLPNSQYRQSSGHDKNPKFYAANIIQIIDDAVRFGAHQDLALHGRLRMAYGEAFDMPATVTTNYKPVKKEEIQPQTQPPVKEEKDAPTAITESGGDLYLAQPTQLQG